MKATPAVERLLQRLSQHVSDVLGRPVSHSAILRALLSYANQQPPSGSSSLYPFIEQEIEQARVWGSTKK
jgi:hypothetical protein